MMTQFVEHSMTNPETVMKSLVHCIAYGGWILDAFGARFQPTKKPRREKLNIVVAFLCATAMLLGMKVTKSVKAYLVERARIAGRAGRGDSKRKGAFASWSPEGRAKRAELRSARLLSKSHDT
jgi:hypothetical protein